MLFWRFDLKFISNHHDNWFLCRMTFTMDLQRQILISSVIIVDIQIVDNGEVIAICKSSNGTNVRE